MTLFSCCFRRIKLYNTDKISHRPEDIATMSTKKRSLNHTLDCQKLIRSKFSNRGTIAAEFRPTKPPDFDAIVQKSKVRYETWCTLRYLSHKSEDIHSIPSFSAVNSFLQNDKPMKTKVAFTPILPYVATEYDTVHTVMCNFEDVLLQKSQPYSPLWCDAGVYRLVKELQLLNPPGFDNIFLGLGRGGSRTAATSKMERFVIIVNDLKPLTIITKRSILHVAAVLDPPLIRGIPHGKSHDCMLWKMLGRHWY